MLITSSNKYHFQALTNLKTDISISVQNFIAMFGIFKDKYFIKNTESFLQKYTPTKSTFDFSLFKFSQHVSTQNKVLFR